MNKQRLHSFVNQCWYRKTLLSYLLLPLTMIYQAIIAVRRLAYRRGWLGITHFNVPVIIVGNIAVGGTGKTPFVIWLANLLKQQGYKPGIISHGYGGKAKHYPISVTAQSDPVIVGDESILLARHTQCPVLIAPNRVAAAMQLLQENACNIIISDDGLQHYALGRNIEIIIIDGDRRLGNGFCLPSGPLRESARRLKEADFIVCNGQPQAGENSMKLMAGNFCQVTNPAVIQPAAYFKNKNVHAVAAIGNPNRFFNLLRSMGIDIIEHAFPDHYLFTSQDLAFGANAVVIMTEKDAVKCEHITSHQELWYLPVTAEIDPSFAEKILQSLAKD